MSASAQNRISSFADFWPYYVREHSRPATRAIHFAGTTAAVLVLIASVEWQQWWALVAVPLVGYGLAWASHLGIEKNRPATFKYPLWSLLADWKMWGLMASGRMEREIERLKLR
jgi:hypothetical protein